MTDSKIKFLTSREMEACGQILESLLKICQNLVKMHQNSEDGNLYSKEFSHDNLITRNAKVINQTCFYGRAIGFQYCDSMKPVLRFLAVSMASFSEAYFSTGYKLMRTTSSLFGSSKYFLDPELCAQRIMNVTKNAEIRFCKVKGSFEDCADHVAYNFFIPVFLVSGRRKTYAHSAQHRRL